MTTRLASILTERGESRSALARRCGLHYMTVCDVVKGRVRPWPGQLAKIAAALGVSDEEAESLLEQVEA